MATATHKPTPGAPAPQPPGMLPLENGDRLTRAEFERRYAAMPQLKKAELIEGVVYRPSPVSSGLWLDAAALLRGDLAAVARAVQRGVASPAHAAFVRRLQQASMSAPGTPGKPARGRPRSTGHRRRRTD